MKSFVPRMFYGRFLAASLCLVFARTSAARATEIGWPFGGIDIHASSAGEQGSLHLDGSEAVWDGWSWVWTIVGPVSINGDNGHSLAILQDMRVTATVSQASGGINPNPRGPSLQTVSMDFGILNNTNAPMMFTTVAGPVAFSPLINPQGHASAGLTVTDRNGDGATLTGNFAGGKTYSANYNGAAPGGSLFALLVDSTNVPTAFGTQTRSEEAPAPGAYSTIPGAVNSISSAFSFTLSAQDAMSATAIFVVQVPEPGTLGLIVVAALGLLRRSRRSTLA